MLSQVKTWLERKWATGKQAPKPADLLHAYAEISELVIHDLLDKFYFVEGIPDDPTAVARHVGHQDVLFVILQTQDLARFPDKYKAEVINGGSNADR